MTSENQHLWRSRNPEKKPLRTDGRNFLKERACLQYLVCQQFYSNNRVLRLIVALLATDINFRFL